nr:fasciclin domain-containing protein [Pontibaca salina]
MDSFESSSHKLVSLTSVQGGALHVNATDGVKVENATVAIADIRASNGVIHAIVSVLLPN